MTTKIINDPLFEVKTIASTPNPQKLCWLAAHQDYSEGYVGNQTHEKEESFYGTSVINHCIKYGHWGVLEHPSITLAVGYFPHSVLVQARTHRIGCCLSGDTVLRFSTSPGGTESRKKSLKELYKLWSLGRKHQTGEKEILNAKKRISSRELWQLNEDTKELSRTKIVDVFESGEKEVYNITLEDGKSLKATLDHKVFTPEGWKRFGETSPGDEVYTVSLCGDDKDNALDRGKAVKIKSIEYAGVEMTYDLEVEGPYHNFLANWFVVHNSFDAQSMRYTSKRFLDYYEKYESGRATIKDLEELFYFRPCGEYADRQGGHYVYSGRQRRLDEDSAERSLIAYAQAVQSGVAEEHARDLLASGYRQHFVVSFNLRSALHFLDLRSKADAQPEIRALSHFIFREIKAWAPEISDFYEKSRFGKARLSP